MERTLRKTGFAFNKKVALMRFLRLIMDYEFYLLLSNCKLELVFLFLLGRTGGGSRKIFAEAFYPVKYSYDYHHNCYHCIIIKPKTRVCRVKGMKGVPVSLTVVGRLFME